MGALVALALPLRASAQELRLGSEFQINAYTQGAQSSSSVALAPGGGFVLVWDDGSRDGSFDGVFGRRFSRAGAALAGEFQVNSYTVDAQRRQSVAVNAGGGFVVVWNSYLQDGSEYGVFARRFSSAGAPLATEFQVNTYTEDYQYHPLVADTAGDFVVIWIADNQDGDSGGVFGRRFSSAGAPLTTEFRVNSFTSSTQYRPALAADEDGDFVVAWTSFGQDAVSGGGVFAQRFSSAGAPVATEFQVNTYTPGNQRIPYLAADADGDFIVVWQSYGQDGSLEGVFARRFSSTGAALTGEFQISTYTSTVQLAPRVATAPGGDFVIAWSSLHDGSSIGVFARRFSSAGSPQAVEFQVSTYTSDSQSGSAVVLDADGRFLIAWDSNGQDGASLGVFAQRFGTPRTLDLDGDGLTEPLTDGLLLLRYLFGFRAAALTTGAVELAGCTRCDAASIETHLAGIALPQPLAEDVRVGSEFRVNAHTTNNQTAPSVAVAAQGNFVAAWSSVYQDGENTGVFARRFSMAGAALATEFQVNSSTVSFQDGPSVAVDGGGRFVIAWNSFYQDYSSFGVFARRFSSAGAPVASEFQVNSYTTLAQFVPSVAADAGGDFVVTWESSQDGQNNGVFARFLSTSGSTLGSEFQVNAYTAGGQRYPSMASAGDGDFVVAWESAQDGLGTNGIFARQFSSSGTGLATEFQVNTYTPSGQDRASVAASASGDFLVAWQSFGQDGSSHGVFARRFSSAGTPQASEFRANTTTTNIQRGASVAADAGGRFVIAWQDAARDGAGFGVFARRVSSAGVPVASEFQINTSTAGDQLDPSVSADGQGHLVIAWQDSVRDGNGYGVFAQRFVTAEITMDIDGDGAAEPLTDGLLVLRYLFGFRGPALVNGAVGGGCTRCDAPAIEGHIAGFAS